MPGNVVSSPNCNLGSPTQIINRYINDCIIPEGWNVIFDKRPAESCAYVTAIRDISPNEEIFVDYGRWYWAGKKPVKAKLR